MGSYGRAVGGAHWGGNFLSGVYKAPKGATDRFASNREEGQQWKENRVPVISSDAVTSQPPSIVNNDNPVVSIALSLAMQWLLRLRLRMRLLDAVALRAMTKDIRLALPVTQGQTDQSHFAKGGGFQ